mmetsp:Transcript_4824/g.10803  ORF Transcript_4824/g.10803 Transcript_4824/m.10803 type:complete len:227 (-) Transcript_4824:85-765(-)
MADGGCGDDVRSSSCSCCPPSPPSGSPPPSAGAASARIVECRCCGWKPTSLKSLTMPSQSCPLMTPTASLTCLIFGTLSMYPSKCPSSSLVASTRCAALPYLGTGCLSDTVAATLSCSAAWSSMWRRLSAVIVRWRCRFAWSSLFMSRVISMTAASDLRAWSRTWWTRRTSCDDAFRAWTTSRASVGERAAWWRRVVERLPSSVDRREVMADRRPGRAETSCCSVW